MVKHFLILSAEPSSSAAGFLRFFLYLKFWQFIQTVQFCISCHFNREYRIIDLQTSVISFTSFLAEGLLCNSVLQHFALHSKSFISNQCLPLLFKIESFFVCYSFMKEVCRLSQSSFSTNSFPATGWLRIVTILNFLELLLQSADYTSVSLTSPIQLSKASEYFELKCSHFNK